MLIQISGQSRPLSVLHVRRVCVSAASRPLLAGSSPGSPQAWDSRSDRHYPAAPVRSAELSNLSSRRRTDEDGRIRRWVQTVQEPLDELDPARRYGTDTARHRTHGRTQEVTSCRRVTLRLECVSYIMLMFLRSGSVSPHVPGRGRGVCFTRINNRR